MFLTNIKIIINWIILLVACEEGYWGDGCTNLCRCMIGTDCNATTGCVECSDAGLTGNDYTAIYIWFMLC